MAGQITLINFGGTLLMKEKPGEGFVPFYSLEDVALAEYMRRHGQTDKLKELLEKGQAFYAIQPHRSLAEIRDGIREGNFSAQQVTMEYLARQELDTLGYDPTVRSVGYTPIDSINFDINTHYEGLRKTVLDTIAQGNVPVIAGGTDTLRYYGTLLNEDLQQLHASGALPRVPPVILASSMLPFGETKTGLEQQHVYRLLKAARVAADEALIRGKSGVFALLPKDEAVSSASLLDMGKPTDKISGRLVKSFIGTEVEGMGEINPDEAMPERPAQHYTDAPIGAGLAQPKPFRHRLVAPPIEGGNGLRNIAMYLQMLYRGPHIEEAPFAPFICPFETLIIKFPIVGSKDGLYELAEAVKRLREQNIDVLFVRDPVADGKGTLDFPAGPPDPRTKDIEEELKRAGGIFVDSMTSTQAVVRAQLLNEDRKPVWFEQERAASQAAASSYHSQHTRMLLPPRGTFFGIEYIPDTKAYATQMQLLDKLGIHGVVSLNCTDGALAEAHAETFAGLKNIEEVLCSFKYAGREYPGLKGRESATLSVYEPSVTMAKVPQVIAGKERTPNEWMTIAVPHR